MAMLKKQLTEDDITLPIAQGHHANELEYAMSAVFRQMVKDGLLQEFNELFQYGTPFLGDRTVIERFTKLNGLAVLRRSDDGLSDKIMSIILANWQALASERGVAFLQFVLNMLYPRQNKIIRLWHSKQLSNFYPTYVSEDEGEDKFLTSRVRIKLDNNIDIGELSELVPVFRRLVPWHIVPEVAINVDIQEIDVGMALAITAYHIQDYYPVTY